ncbi:hypothetical protein H5410_044308 [Solanum commersonii]|uniref:Uncharacterized protein n=1 Tax=Solanum commersonii TaxID=4109 RepID=A0A9J5X7P2_SOLCO|nr:hypothetical protein H5410_044308 [Solanum commersonii]
MNIFIASLNVFYVARTEPYRAFRERDNAMAANASLQMTSYRVALPKYRQRKSESSHVMAANIPKLHATRSQASGSLPRQDTGQVQNSSSPGTSSWTSWKLRLRSAKNWGKEKATTAMAAKEPVACEREDSITSHPDLPCQDTGQIVSMPQTITISPKIANIITA